MSPSVEDPADRETSSNAWDQIVTKTEEELESACRGRVTASVTSVTFSEGLLRPIVSLTELDRGKYPGSMIEGELTSYRWLLTADDEE